MPLNRGNGGDLPLNLPLNGYNGTTLHARVIPVYSPYASGGTHAVMSEFWLAPALALLTFLLGVLCGHGLETTISITRGKHQAKLRREINDKLRQLHRYRIAVSQCTCQCPGCMDCEHWQDE